MKRLFLSLITIALCLGSVGAQSLVVTGKVLNATDGEPIIGASIVVKGTSQGTITDYDGEFVLNTDASATLVVSYIGLKTQELAAQEKMTIRLAEDTKMIDEVMVVAFGTATKKSFTGSASVVKADEIIKQQTSNITNALAGQVAGVQGLVTSGQPGEMATIRIRGIGSMNASNAPLYVIDGVPAGADAITTLANQDIESVTVLKDAASAALYGARGANGVILITTKRGNTHNATINVDAKWGTNQRAVPNYSVMTDPAMYYETYYQAMKNFGGAEFAAKNFMDPNNNGLDYMMYTVPAGELLIGSNGKLNPNAKLGVMDPSGYYLQPDNWYKSIFKNNNLRQEYNVNISGATDKLTYYASAGYLDDSGIVENSTFKRVTARLNVDYQVKKWLKVGTNMSYSHADQGYPGETEYDATSSGNIFYLANNVAPYYPLYIRNSDGSIAKDKNGYTLYDYGDGTVVTPQRIFMPQSNPASANEMDIERYKKDIFTGKWFVQAELYKGLKATANVGVHYGGVRFQNIVNPFYGQYASMGGITTVEADREITVDQQYMLNYANTFGDHHVDVMAGYENYKMMSSYVYGSKTKVYSPNVAEVSNAILDPNTASGTTNYFLQGAFAQAKYDYAGRYYFSASYRADGSSRFAPGKQWGHFWSVGAAWDMGSESWMEDVDVVDLLKVKFSYGTQGNDALLTQSGGMNYYPYTDLYTIEDNNGEIAPTLAEKGNKDITWETSHNLNAGVDFSLFEERLNGTIDGWMRRTSNMLYFQPVPASNGYSFLPVNVGSVQNAGLDIELDGDAIRNRHVTWNIYLNMSYYKNKILKLADELNGQMIEGSYLYKEGESMYNRYMRCYAGVDPTTGKALWYTGDNKESKTSDYGAAQKYELGDILPKVSGGFGTSLEVYGVDLSIGFNYQLGGKIYDSAYASLMHAGSSANRGQNWHTDILKAWTPENTDTDVPILDLDDYANRSSDRFLVSSNYLTLQNITLGYTLPQRWTQVLKIEKLRIYAVADNVALVAARKGLDPRMGFGSADNTNYSPLRSISAGLSLTF